MNSISSGSRCCAARHGRGAVVHPQADVFTTNPRDSNSRVIGVPGYGVGCWMYGQSMYRLANSRFATTDSRRSSGLPTIRPPTTTKTVTAKHVPPRRGPCWYEPVGSQTAVLGARLQEHQIVVENVLDAEKDITKSGAPHQRCKRPRLARRLGRSFPERDSRCDSNRPPIPASHNASNRSTSRVMLSSTRKMLRAPRARASSDVIDHAFEWESMKIAASASR